MSAARGETGHHKVVGLRTAGVTRPCPNARPGQKAPTGCEQSPAAGAVSQMTGSDDARLVGARGGTVTAHEPSCGIAEARKPQWGLAKGITQLREEERGRRINTRGSSGCLCRDRKPLPHIGPRRPRSGTRTARPQHTDVLPTPHPVPRGAAPWSPPQPRLDPLPRRSTVGTMVVPQKSRTSGHPDSRTPSASWLCQISGAEALRGGRTVWQTPLPPSRIP